MLSREFDVLVFLYSSGHLTNSQRHAAFHFNLVAETLNKLNLTVGFKAVAYDLNINAFPESIEYQTITPLIYFYPATKKRQAPLKYVGEIIAGEMLRFMETNSGFDIEFPVDLSRIGRPKE